MRLIRSVLKRAILWSPWAALMACGSTPEDTGTLAPLDYSEAGDFSAGTFTVSTTGTDDLSLRLQVWYPSAEAPGMAVAYDGVWPGTATEDLTADCSTPRPVMVFSHGAGGIRWQSPFWTEHLASHGYVVVAPDHPQSTFADYDGSALYDVAQRRPTDAADAFDWLVAQSETTDSPLAGCVDAEAGYAISGHSFGGYTSYVAAGAQIHNPQGEGLLSLGDERTWAVVAMAPWEVNGLLTPDTMSTVGVPVMTLSGRLDEDTTWSEVSGLHDAIETTPRYLGEFPRGGHASFAPITCTFFGGEDGCGDDYIDEATLTRLVSSAGTAFLESVRGVEGAEAAIPVDSDDLVWVE